MVQDNFKEYSPLKSLTGIHSQYTLSNTPEAEYREIDKVMIHNLITVLADVSLAISMRRASGSSDKKS
jgi:hypothetical protein